VIGNAVRGGKRREKSKKKKKALAQSEHLSPKPVTWQDIQKHDKKTPREKDSMETLLSWRRGPPCRRLN